MLTDTTVLNHGKLTGAGAYLVSMLALATLGDADGPKLLGAAGTLGEAGARALMERLAVLNEGDELTLTVAEGGTVILQLFELQERMKVAGSGWDAEYVAAAAALMAELERWQD